jgi:hypothetical protein
MNSFMTRTTYDKRLTPPCCHLFHPCRFVFSPWFLQIRQFANMMNLYFLFGTAEFAGICEDSLKEFASVSHEELRRMIDEDCIRFR